MFDIEEVYNFWCSNLNFDNEKINDFKKLTKKVIDMCLENYGICILESHYAPADLLLLILEGIDCNNYSKIDKNNKMIITKNNIILKKDDELNKKEIKLLSLYAFPFYSNIDLCKTFVNNCIIELKGDLNV